MSRLVPAYVERPAWAAYVAAGLLQAELELEPGSAAADALEDLVDVLEDLRRGLVRGGAVVHAPEYVLAQELLS